MITYKDQYSKLIMVKPYYDRINNKLRATMLLENGFECEMPDEMVESTKNEMIDFQYCNFTFETVCNFGHGELKVKIEVLSPDDGEFIASFMFNNEWAEFDDKMYSDNSEWILAEIEKEYRSNEEA